MQVENWSLLLPAIGQQKNHYFARAQTVKWKRAMGLGNVVELWNKYCAENKHVIELEVFHPVVISNKWPNVEPYPYWIRNFNTWKVGDQWQ